MAEMGTRSQREGDASDAISGRRDGAERMGGAVDAAQFSRKVEAIWHGVDLDEWPLSPPKEAPKLPAGIEADPIWGAPMPEDSPYVLWNKTRTDPVCNPLDMVKLARLAPDVPFRTTFWPEGEPLPANVTVTGKLGY